MTQTPPAERKLRVLGEVLRLLSAETDVYARRRLMISFWLVIGASALAALVPILYKLVIDAFSGQPPSAIWLTPAVLIVGYVLLQFVQTGLGTLRSLVHGFGIQRINRRLSERLFAHIVRLPLRFHLERRTGAVGATLSQGLNGCQLILQHLLLTFLPVIAEFFTVVAVLIHFGHAPYLVVFALAAGAYVAAFWQGASAIAQPARTVSQSYIEAHAALTDGMLNTETVKYFNAEADICSRYSSALGENESAFRRLLGFQTRNSLCVSMIYTVSLGLCLGLAGYEVLRQTMTAGDFVLINSYVARLMVPLQTIGFAIRDLSQAIAYVEKMLELFRERPEIAMVEDGSADTDIRGELRFEHVNFSYETERGILNDVSFTVPAGRTVALVGASGSGKTSIIRLLFRLYDPDGGQIILDGVPISRMPLAVLRSVIAVVPQDTVLFNDSIGRNIGFGRRGASRAEIEEAARVAHLHGFIGSLPDGYDTRVGERGLKLSGGEKQRVAIARAALKHPRIFVFDEATSSLDSQTEWEILQNLVDVSKRCTTLVIAHRLSTVVHADRIIVLHQGTIAEQGTHNELLQLNGRYATVWQAQQVEMSRR